MLILHLPIGCVVAPFHISSVVLAFDSWIFFMNLLGITFIVAPGSIWNFTACLFTLINTQWFAQPVTDSVDVMTHSINVVNWTAWFIATFLPYNSKMVSMVTFLADGSSCRTLRFLKSMFLSAKFKFSHNSFCLVLLRFASVIHWPLEGIFGAHRDVLCISSLSILYITFICHILVSALRKMLMHSLRVSLPTFNKSP